MGIPTFDVDMNIISKLSDYPGADDGLTPDAFRAKFDLGGKLIQEYINTILLPNINMTSDVDALVNGVEKQLTTVFNNNMAIFFNSVIQSGDYVLDSGYKFNITKASDTLFRMYGGEAVIQGHIAQMNLEEALSIPVVSGTYGTSRNDLICIRFERSSDRTEAISIVYLQGQATQGEVSDPGYRQDNINVMTASARDLPLYRIKVRDTTATSEALFTPYGNISKVIADQVIKEFTVWEGGNY